MDLSYNVTSDVVYPDHQSLAGSVAAYALNPKINLIGYDEKTQLEGKQTPAAHLLTAVLIRVGAQL